MIAQERLELEKIKAAVDERLDFLAYFENYVKANKGRDWHKSRTAEI